MSVTALAKGAHTVPDLDRILVKATPRSSRHMPVVPHDTPTRLPDDGLSSPGRRCGQALDVLGSLLNQSIGINDLGKPPITSGNALVFNTVPLSTRTTVDAPLCRLIPRPIPAQRRGRAACTHSSISNARWRRSGRLIPQCRHPAIQPASTPDQGEPERVERWERHRDSDRSLKGRS
jgi:hypothetical protein